LYAEIATETIKIQVDKRSALLHQVLDTYTLSSDTLLLITNQPTNQPTKQPTNQPTNQPANQSTNKQKQTN
jgi:hypothetical protein